MADEQQDPTVNGATTDPEWFGQALELASTGMGAEEIAVTVEKHVSTVRKLIRRKTESGEFVPPSAGVQGGVQPVEPSALVDADTAARLRAAAGDSAGDPDEDEPELFPLGTVAGDGIALKHLSRPGQENALTIALMSAEVPAPKDSGLLKPEQEAYLLVTVEPMKYTVVPQKDGERGNRTQTGLKTRQVVRPVFVERVSADSTMVQANFRALLAQDQKKAGELLDALTGVYRAALSE